MVYFDKIFLVGFAQIAESKIYLCQRVILDFRQWLYHQQ